MSPSPLRATPTASQAHSAPPRGSTHVPVGYVSHELRMPPASARGYAEMLQNGDLGTPSEKQTDAFRVIARSVERLSLATKSAIEHAAPHGEAA